MFSFIQRNFIPNYDKVKNAEVRERYGIVISIFSIICNIVLVVIKLLISFIVNSVSIRADALNNLSDIGSNVATLAGFKLSGKHPDSDHPYGHGRYEYVTGMIISFLILLMGVSAFKSSVTNIFNPNKLSFSFLAILVLIISILIKTLMYSINNKTGKLINSESFIAAGQDSINDAITTGATLLSLLVYLIFKINIDAIVGTIVSLLVIKSGIEIFRNVLDVILGKAPDKELVKKIEKYIMSHKVALGIHDLMLHDYGPSSKFMTVHVEVDASGDIVSIHDEIDNIEKGILKKFNILTTIHMDPVVVNDPLVKKYKKLVIETVKEIDERYMIHDFRVVSGPTHANLIFDLLVPSDVTTDHKLIKKDLTHRIHKKDKTLNVICEIEHSYVD